MTVRQIDASTQFYAPYFVIEVDGRAAPASVVNDIWEVTFEDSLTDFEFFEFTLNDWDPVRNAPRYSSPGSAGSDVPSFEPGARASLKLGYQGASEPITKLIGTIVSIAPRFPANGLPTMVVRVISDLYRLQGEQSNQHFEDETDTAVAQSLADELGIGVATTAGQAAGETPHEFLALNNEYPINFLLRRARRLGYDLQMLPEVDPALGLTVTGGADGEPVLFFGPSQDAPASHRLAWGRSLTSFEISVRIKEQAGSLTVRSTNPSRSGRQRDIEAVATLDDIELDLPDPSLFDAIKEALAPNNVASIDRPVDSQAEADALAQGLLREQVKELITARGSTVGVPELRAGGSVEVTGIGPRYSGRWLLTKTTHKLDASGYTTSFTARLEGPPTDGEPGR